MYDRYIESLSVESKKIEKIKFNWEIASRPLLKSLSLKDENLSLLLVGRFSALESLSAEWCFCGAVEKRKNISVSMRVKYMRAILCELQRIAWGIDYYARLFLELEDFLREQISRSIFDTVLNLQEDLTGGRILPQAFIVGGLRREFSLGDFEKVKKMSLWFEQKLEDVLKGIEEDQIIQRKMRNRIKIDKSLFSEKKISGPLAQACGYLLDERAQAVEGPYRDHSVQFYRTSKKESSEICFLDIFKSVNFQLKQSADLLKKLCMNVPKEHKLAEKQIEGSGLEKIVFSVEAPSGRMSCVLDGQKISFQSTTTELTPFLPKLLRGTYRDYVNLSLLNLGIDPGQNAV